MRLTRIGGPTVLAEFDGWRVLIDPTFDPPGRRYAFAASTSSVKTLGPAIPADELGPIDVMLVSHDHHADNLDDAGRAMLPSAGHVVTTTSGARRLALPHTHGLDIGQTVRLEADDRPALEITATPARHGPTLLKPIVGDVIGFAVRRAGESRVALWVSGDTVPHPALRTAAAEMDVDVAIVNAGGVRFGLTGPVRFTMTGAEAVSLLDVLAPRVAVAAHYDGWSHFRDGEEGVRAAVRAAPQAVRERVRWLPDGVPVDL
ncbi:MBL fold metallo-hydrolase [Microbacterium terricola]|uniref:MBL fold metallo-hydrolase n=1 Tax=Microbacterium terricola TaxID=344163 RepID=A0ABM8DZK7_9MICO|nr:MBL fold metallo-hydrolase [Microbacterium terricola]UYK41269.1 MBL fold metallo-hydrolase [Microbacterium terricola]BDV30951.1 MBL fold metallo-hydrolase [Microbacterium terricola]